MAYPLSRFFYPRIGIDIGTSQLRVWIQSHRHPVGEVCFDERCCVAVEAQTGKVLAIGNEAASMVGRVENAVIIHEPVVAGKVAEPEIFQALLRVILYREFGLAFWFRPVMVVTVPGTSSSAYRQSLQQICLDLGAREVYTLSQVLAAAIGAGVPVADASGTFLFQIGAGVAEAAVIALGMPINTRKTDGVGRQLDKAIQTSVRQELGVTISLTQAEQLKVALGTVSEADQHKKSQGQLVTGQDVASRSPREVMVKPEHIMPGLQQAAAWYQAAVQQLLSRLPPELVTDIIDKGMLLSGGGAQLRGLDQWLIRGLGIPVSLVDDASQVTLKGVGVVLENIDLYAQSLAYRSAKILDEEESV